MRVNPMGDNLLVRPLKPEETKTSGGIIIPESVTQREPLHRAEIVAISEDIKTDRRPGDIVLYYPKYSTPITIDQQECALIRITDVQAWIGE